MLARVQVRYPDIPILFLEARKLAEEWTFRYLGAALAEHLEEQDRWTDARRGPARRRGGAIHRERGALNEP